MHGLDWLIDSLKSAAGDNLVALTIRGPATQDKDAATRSLSTLLVVLTDTSPAALGALGDALRQARRRIRLEPIIMKASEIQGQLDVLPLKALGFRFHGTVLFGPHPFADLEIDRANVRMRAEQELRNLVLRLRHDLCLGVTDQQRLRAGLWRTARGVERVLDGLWFLEKGAAAVPEDVWQGSANAWDLPPDAVALLEHLGDSDSTGDSGSTADVAAVAAKVLPLLETMTLRVDRMEV